MTNLLKSLFGIKRIITDDQLFNTWENSKKGLKDLENLITKISASKKTDILFEQIVKIEIKNKIDLNELIKYLNKYSLGKDTETYNKITHIISNFEFILNLFSVVGEEKFNQRYLFNNKYKNLMLIEENFDLKNEQLLELIYLKYLTKEEYFRCLEYTLIRSKEASNIYKLFLPNEKNFRLLDHNNCILYYVNFTNLFEKSELNEKIESSNINFYLNILIYFSRQNDRYIALILSHLKSVNVRDFENLNSIFQYYKIYMNVSTLTMGNKKKYKSFQFFCSNSIYRSFSKNILSDISKCSHETFISLLGEFITVHKLLLKNFEKKIEFLPKLILNLLLKDKAPLKNLSSYLTLLYNNLYENSIQNKFTIKNMVIKYYLENFSNSLANSLLIYELLEMNKSHFQCEELCIDFSRHLKFMKILDNFNIPINILELIEADYKVSKAQIEFKSCKVNKILIEYLTKISKKFQSNSNFIDKNVDCISDINEYLSRFSVNFNDILLDYLKSFSFSNKAIRIVIENHYLNSITQKEFENFLNVFIEYKNELKEDELDEYLQDIKEILKDEKLKIKIDKNFEHRLRNLFRYFNIKKVFNNNQMSTEILKEFDFEHLNLNLNLILEIFIFKKFNLDLVESLEIFYERTQDIYQAIDIDKLEYLENLFIIFFKYQKEKLFVEILKFFLDFKKGYEYFEKCLNLMKKSSIDLKEFLIKNEFKLKLMENSENYNLFIQNEEFLEKIDFKNNKSQLKVNLDNEDFFTLLYLKDNNHSELINNDEFFKENIKSNFFKFIKNLNSLKEEKKEQSKNYKYSFHPKLKNIFDKINFDYNGKEFEFNSKMSYKFKLYKFIIKKGLINCVEDILEFENISLSIVENYDYLLNVCKLLMNLYDDSNSYLFVNSVEKLKKNELLNKNELQLLNDLLEYNLSNFKYVNIYHIEFMNKIFIEIKINCEMDNILKLITKISKNKFNILPFTDKFQYVYENSISMKNNYIEINSNVNYFRENIWLKHISNKLNSSKINLINFQMIEIYRNINMNNYNNFSKIKLLNNENVFFSFNNVKLLLILKLCSNMTNILSVNLNYCFKIKDICEIIKSFSLSEEDLKLLCYEILFLPNLNYVIEFNMGISLFEKNFAGIIKDILNTKLILYEQIFDNFKSCLSTCYLVTDTYKIFKIKYSIIQSFNESDIIINYDKLRDLNQYENLKKFIVKNEKLKNEIEKIYTMH